MPRSSGTYPIVIVARLMAEVVRAALADHDTVQVTPEFGNHGRIGSKRDGVPLPTNLDRMAYLLARQELAADLADGRLVWEDSIEDIQRLEIGAAVPGRAAPGADTRGRAGRRAW